MKFYSSLLFLALFAVSSFASNVDNVLADISTISSQLNTLDTSITSFPTAGGSIAAALNIHTQFVNLATSVHEGTTDTTSVTPKPFSGNDGNTVLTAVQGFVPTFLDALKQVVIKKPPFDGLPIGGVGALIKQDLITLNASNFALEAALIGAIPSDLINIILTIKATLDAALATALAGCANF